MPIPILAVLLIFGSNSQNGHKWGCPPNYIKNKMNIIILKQGIIRHNYRTSLGRVAGIELWIIYDYCTVIVIQKEVAGSASGGCTYGRATEESEAV